LKTPKVIPPEQQVVGKQRYRVSFALTPGTSGSTTCIYLILFFFVIFPKKKKKKEIKAAMGLAIMCYYFRVNRSPRDKGCLLRFNI
jgi:hypothetical protein